MKLWNKILINNAIPTNIRNESEKLVRKSDKLTKSLLNYHISNYFRYGGISHFFFDNTRISRPETKLRLKKELIQLFTPLNIFQNEQIDLSVKATMPYISRLTSNIFKPTTLKCSRNTSKFNPSLTKTTSLNNRSSNKHTCDDKIKKKCPMINNCILKKSNDNLLSSKYYIEPTVYNKKLYRSLSQLMKTDNNYQFNLKKIAII